MGSNRVFVAMAWPAAALYRHSAMTDVPDISLASVRAAAAAIGDAVERTPFRKSITLSEILGAELWLKFENLQFTASFKERGALNKLLHLNDDERRAGVVAVSAGNHAQAVAYHGRRLGIPVTIVMPAHTPFVKVENTRSHGAEVVLHGESLDEATEHARRLMQERHAAFIHPFDDPLIIAGQGTVALEMLEDEPDLDCLIVPVGGL